jgi:hypothetical protein
MPSFPHLSGIRAKEGKLSDGYINMCIKTKRVKPGSLSLKACETDSTSYTRAAADGARELYMYTPLGVSDDRVGGSVA